MVARKTRTTNLSSYNCCIRDVNFARWSNGYSECLPPYDNGTGVTLGLAGKLLRPILMPNMSIELKERLIEQRDRDMTKDQHQEMRYNHFAHALTVSSVDETMY